MAEPDPRYKALLDRLQEWMEIEPKGLEVPPPDEAGDAQMDAGIEWLREKWGDNNPCPYCGNETYGIGVPASFVLNEPGEEAGISIPFFPVTCRNCGVAAFIDLRVFGESLDEEQTEDA